MDLNSPSNIIYLSHVAGNSYIQHGQDEKKGKFSSSPTPLEWEKGGTPAARTGGYRSWRSSKFYSVVEFSGNYSNATGEIGSVLSA